MRRANRTAATQWGIYFHDRERVTIIASKLGLPQHPAWYHNLRVHPDVKLGGQPFHAEVVDDDSERARIWQLADQVFPPYANYRPRPLTRNTTRS